MFNKINRWFVYSIPIFIVQINNDDWWVVRTFYFIVVQLETDLNDFKNSTSIKIQLSKVGHEKKKILMINIRIESIQNFTQINFVLCLLKNLSHSIYFMIKKQLQCSTMKTKHWPKIIDRSTVCWYGFTKQNSLRAKKINSDPLLNSVSTVWCDCNFKRSVTHWCHIMIHL